METGESQDKDGRYCYKYNESFGKRKSAYSWRDDSIGIGAEAYLRKKGGVKHNTQMNYNLSINVIKKKEFRVKQIDTIKLSDAKTWLIKL